MRKLIIAVFLTNLVSFAICNTNPETAESRKNVVRSPTASVGTASHLNSLQSNQDPLLAKAQQALQQQALQQQSLQQHSQQQTHQQTLQSQQTLTQSAQPQTYTRISQDYGGVSHTHSPVYTHVQQSQPTPASGGYFISVNPQGGHSISPAGPTPVIMQYLPHNPQSGPIQYLQLIPTRPLIVPISPYISHQYNPYGQTQSQPAAAAASYPTLPSAHHAYQTSASTHNYNAYQPALQSPIGGYSNNYLSYLRPNPGLQLVSGPVDLSLNTNEYLPIQSESSYKVRRP